MGEMRTMNTVLGAIYDPDTINAAFRALPRELQNLLGGLVFFGLEEPTIPWDAGQGRVAGFRMAAFGSSPNITVACTGGVGLVYNDAPPTLASKWAWIHGDPDVVVTVSGIVKPTTHPRIDVLALAYTQNTDTPVNVGFVNAVPATVDTQRGCQLTFVRIPGTEDPDPVAPAMPPGHLKLGELKLWPSGAYQLTRTVRPVRPRFEWRTYPWVTPISHLVSGNTAGLGVTYDASRGAVKVARTSSSDVEKLILLPLPTVAKGASCAKATLLYEYHTEFSGGPNVIEAQLVRVTLSGTQQVGMVDLVDIGPGGGRQAREFVAVSPPPPTAMTPFTLGDPEAVGGGSAIATHVRLRVSLNGFGSQGELYLYGVRMLLKEHGGME